MIFTSLRIAFGLMIVGFLFFSMQFVRAGCDAATLRSELVLDTKKITKEYSFNYPQDYLPSDKPVNCEDVMLYLDDSINRTNQNKDAYLIVIGQLGRRERAGLNRIRLAQIESYLKRKFNGRLVTAEGARVDGLGRVMIYVGGRLTYTMPIRKNSRFFCASPIG